MLSTIGKTDGEKVTRYGVKSTQNIAKKYLILRRILAIMGQRKEHDSLKVLLIETITLLCRNGLRFKNKFSIEGLLGKRVFLCVFFSRFWSQLLIGITADDDEVLLVNINEIIDDAAKEPLDKELASLMSAQGENSLKKEEKRSRKRLPSPSKPTDLRVISDNIANCAPTKDVVAHDVIGVREHYELSAEPPSKKRNFENSDLKNIPPPFMRSNHVSNGATDLSIKSEENDVINLGENESDENSSLNYKKFNYGDVAFPGMGDDYISYDSEQKSAENSTESVDTVNATQVGNLIFLNF